jgi:nicotinamidase-related amidase
MLDYHIVVVEDCTASYKEEAHQATLSNIRRAFGRVATADEIAALWRKAGLLESAIAAA